VLRAPGLDRIVPNLERVKTLADETPQRLGVDAVPG